MKRTTLIAIGIVLALTGCQKRARIVSLPPVLVPIATAPLQPTAAPLPVEELPAPAPPVEPVPDPSPLEAADLDFDTGNYAQAVRAYEDYVKDFRFGNERDHALFRLGLIFASPGPERDWNRAAIYMKQLAEEHPFSPLKPSAAVILSLYTEVTQLRTDSLHRDVRIKQLTTELEKLKKIDAERRKR
jgi:hypothetical protein